MVEFSSPTRETWVRFLANALLLCLCCVVFVLSFARPWTEECYSLRDGQKSERTERLTHIYLFYTLKRMDSRFLKG